MYIAGVRFELPYSYVLAGLAPYCLVMAILTANGGEEFFQILQWGLLCSAMGTVFRGFSLRHRAYGRRLIPSTFGVAICLSICLLLALCVGYILGYEGLMRPFVPPPLFVVGLLIIVLGAEHIALRE